MNFDNLILNDLMTGLYCFIPSLLILIFCLWQYSLYCVIECVKEFKTHSVETVSEASQNSNGKSDEKLDQKVKRILKTV